MKIIDWFNEGLIPGLLYFQNSNTHTGSVNDRESKDSKEFRYKIGSSKGVIKAEVWYGPYCYDESEIIDQSEFFLNDDGRTEMLRWIKEKYESMVG